MTIRKLRVGGLAIDVKPPIEPLITLPLASRSEIYHNLANLS
jgi:hypothetical protein